MLTIFQLNIILWVLLITIIWWVSVDNGLMPNRRQTLIWTKGDQDIWRVYIRHYAKKSYQLMTEQDGLNFADDIFKCIFLRANVCIQSKIALKSILKGLVFNKPALFHTRCNGLTRNRWQAITWSNADQDISCHVPTYATRPTIFNILLYFLTLNIFSHRHHGSSSRLIIICLIIYNYHPHSPPFQSFWEQ